MRMQNIREANNENVHGKVLNVYNPFLKSKGWEVQQYDADRISGTGFATYKHPEFGELYIRWRKRDVGFPKVIWGQNGGGQGVGKVELAKYLRGLSMSSKKLKENASAGATSAGAIATNLAGGTPPKGQFFGGNPASSIYTTIKKHRKARKEKVAEETKTSKVPKKPSGKAEVIGSQKPYKQPNVLSPTMKVKSTGKMLGGPEKKNPTLSTKLFGTCSATNDPGNKSIIAELTYKEFRNAHNAVSKTCASCGGAFKNIHDANQKFCCKDCETKGNVALKLKEAWERPMQTEFETKDGKIIDMKTVHDLVKRVMDDSGGSMGRLQACLFVSGMLKNCTGWTVLFALEDYAKAQAEAMYGKK